MTDYVLTDSEQGAFGDGRISGTNVMDQTTSIPEKTPTKKKAGWSVSQYILY